MTDTTDIPSDDTALAAEYALGLLSPDDAKAFEARLRTDTSLFALVTAWQSHFAALAEEEVAPVAPPAAVFSRLEATLFEESRPKTWSPLAIWRAMALAGFASTAALTAFLIFGNPTPTELEPAFVAQLAPVTGDAQFVALYDAGAGTLRVQQAVGDAAPDRVQELWLIAGDAAPVSLGLLEADGTTTIPVTPDLQPILTQAVLAVSDEPPGGSPTGAPTGDVLAAGPIISL